MFLSAIKRFFGFKSYNKIRTFTYYLPSPPARKTGYQEKEFDIISTYLMNNGFDIIDYKMQACASEKSSGVWILCLLGAKTYQASKMDLLIDYSEISQLNDSTIKLDPSIVHEH